jgi:peptidoglycan/LPS O-acetylase OafA/YrhL
LNLPVSKHKEQIPVLYVLRALAFLGILFVHVSSVPIGDITDKSSMMFIIINFLNIFNRFGTTTFIFLSAFVLFYRYYDQPVSRKLLFSFYQRRLIYIGIPYIIFSLFYYVIQMYYSYGETWLQFFQAASIVDFIKKLAVGEAFYHLYFVFINLQFYLIFPLLLLLFQRYPSLTKHLFWIGLALQWAFILYNYYSLDYENKGQLAISYASNYFLGAYFGIYYSTLVDWIVITRKKLRTTKAAFWLCLWLVWIASSLTDVYMWYWARSSGTIFNPLLYELVWNCQTFTAALGLLQLADLLFRKLKPKFVNMLLHLGSVSFGMYLVHAGILFYYYRLPVSHAPIVYYPYIAGAYVVTLALSWLIVGHLQKHSRYAWIFLGSAPKVSPFVEWKSAKSTKSSNVSVNLY